MTAPFLSFVDAVERHRACTAPDLTPEQFATAVRFEAAEAAPESWTRNRCPECDEGQVVNGHYEAETGWQYRGCTHCQWTNS